MAEFESVIKGPVSIDAGTILRLVELSDGSARVEIWSPARKRWEPGGGSAGQVALAGNTSEEKLKRFGVPKEDWGLPGTRSEAEF